MGLRIVLKQTLSIPLLICFPLLCVGSQSALGNQQPCGPEEAQALLPVSNPAFADALDLARTLGSRGFVVKCILSSKMEGLFAGQEGAALYRTNRGDFEALFLPKSQNFSALLVVEQRETADYVYSFLGSPRPWPANRMEGSKTYFIKNTNRLFITWDSQVAKILDEVFHSQ
jgi:hypothetical protein